MLTEDKLVQLMCKVDKALGSNRSNQEIFDFIESAVLVKLDQEKKIRDHSSETVQGCFVEFNFDQSIYNTCALEDGGYCNLAEDMKDAHPAASKHCCKYWGDVSSDLEGNLVSLLNGNLVTS